MEIPPPQSCSKSPPKVTYITDKLVSRGSFFFFFVLCCRGSSVPARTPAMNYFTDTAPQGPQCHALMAAVTAMAVSLESANTKTSSCGYERRVECHCSSHRHRSVSLAPPVVTSEAFSVVRMSHTCVNTSGFTMCASGAKLMKHMIFDV